MIPPTAGGISQVVSIERVENVAQIELLEWDRLAGGDSLLSHGWFRTMEECLVRPARRFYLTARRTEGLVAAMPLRLEDSPQIWQNLDRVLFGRFAPLAHVLPVQAVPALVCGSVACPDAAVLMRPGLPIAEREQIQRLLVERAEHLAQTHGYTLCFRSIAAQGSSLAALLGTRGYLRARELPICYLDLPYRSFDEYRRALRQAHPATEKHISWEINRGRRHGLTIEPLDNPGPYYRELHEILELHNGRLNHMPWPYQPSFFEKVKANLRENVVTYAARLEGRIAGVRCLYKSGERARLTMIGVSQSGRPAALYFNLAFNSVIENCLKAGYRGAYFGLELYEMKSRRGCVQIPLDIYLRGRNRMHQTLLAAVLPLYSRIIDRKSRSGARL